MHFLFTLLLNSASAASTHCSSPVWEGGLLLPTEESCQRQILKDPWCQENAANCATCSGIWCTADNSVKHEQKQYTTKSSQSPIDNRPTTSVETSENEEKIEETQKEASSKSSSSSVCTGRPELDALLKRSKIAQISRIADSDVYTWSGFCRAIRMMDGCGLPLELGTHGAEDELAIGAANIASLLAQTMWESGGDAPFSACDENNYTGKKDAACTQRYDSQRYDSLVSPSSCKVDPEMVMTAETHASWTPGPMQCSPGTITEGCCWWGRGAIQTTGPHNYAQLQRDVVGKLPQFENVDLCTNPEAICQVDELKWLGALYYWTNVVQREKHFSCSLQKFVQSGFDLSNSKVGGADFATGCGGSVNNGYWASTPHGNAGRLRYFRSLMKAMRENGLAAPSVSEDADKPCVLKKQNDGSQSTATCSQCSGAENCYVHGWAVPCMETTKEFCDSTHNAVWCGIARDNGESSTDSMRAGKNDKKSVTTAAKDLGANEDKNDFSHIRDVCQECSSSENCYVHGWAVPCMETTKDFCGNTPNSVWCGSSAKGERYQHAEKSKASITSSPIEQSKHDNRNDDAPSAKGPCVTFMTDAQTGHCPSFLREAANRLDASISQIKSFESIVSDAPVCLKGVDGSFASSKGGLWAGVLYKVCADHVEKQYHLQYIEGKSTSNEVSKATNLRKSDHASSGEHEIHESEHSIGTLHEDGDAGAISGIAEQASTTSENIHVADDQHDGGKEASFSFDGSQNFRHSSNARKIMHDSLLVNILSVVALAWTIAFKGQ